MVLLASLPAAFGDPAASTPSFPPTPATLTIPAGDTNQPTPRFGAVASTATGILLQPALYLPEFTHDDFLRISSSVGREKIWKKWTSPVTTLPPLGRAGAHGLTQEEIKGLMREARRLFDEGESVPISDVGLISTQEDVIRRPMMNHIAAFSNEVARVFLLVQKISHEDEWGYYSIVQDLTVNPPLDYFANLTKTKVNFEGVSCYKCHSSGPLAIHAVRADLLSDPPLAAAISKHIAEGPRSRFHFPEKEHPPEYGKPLALKFCTRCHDEDGDRGPLFKAHSHPVRVLVDFGYMPPNRRLRPEEIAQLKAWLDQKPSGQK